MTQTGIAHNGEAIRALRRLQGRSVTDLARSVGVTPQSLSNVELEHKPASAALLNRIAHELEVSLGSICRTPIASGVAEDAADQSLATARA